MKMNKKKFDISVIPMYAFLLAVLFLVIFPVIFEFVNSFKSNMEILAGMNFWPEKLSFDNYIQAWTVANFAKYTWNSVYYCFFNVSMALFFSAVNGYVFARAEFPGKNVIFGIKTGMMFVTLGSSSMYPTLQILKALHLNTSLWGLIIMHFFGSSITNIFLVRSFIFSLPKEMDEAAEIDGCTFIGIFFRIIFPLLKPVMATIGIISFQSSWNDYLMPMIVTLANPEQRTLPVGLKALAGSSDAAAAWNLVMAGAVISSLPMMIIYLFLNKYFVKGMTAGAVKG